MKKYLFVASLIVVGILSCRKYTTPRNVTKILEKDSWKVARMVDSDINITDSLRNVIIAFSAEQRLVVKYSDTATCVGTWEVPTEARNPAKLFMNLPDSVLKIKKLSDDWLVIFKQKEEIHLERLNGKFGASDELILRKL